MRTPRLRRPPRRAGFTLLEVAIALAILGGVLLVLATTTARFVHTVTLDRVRVQANAVADAQVSRVRQWPTYDSLTAVFNGTTSNFPFPGWTRQTTVTRVQGAGNDYTRVTVVVSAPRLPAPVSRSIALAATR